MLVVFFCFDLAYIKNLSTFDLMQTQNTPLQITGICTFIGSVSRGETWQKQEFVIKTEGQYPTEICFSVWNDKTLMLDRCQVNDHLIVKFNPSSRQHNDKWYTELTAWNVTVDFSAARKETTT
jgi:hypothetical protein